MSSAPVVMVSSTFFDLRQIRADLAKFIGEDLGYVPLLSELPSFPVDPDLDTIENCRARVEKNADILVLIVGGRYGSIDAKTEKSITNLEFLAARGKGIPIYVFVEKAILALLPIWKANPSADFSAAVDTTKLFDFVDMVRTQERVWSFPFERAQDVIDILRIQLAHLFRESLAVRLRLSGNSLPPFVAELRPKSLKIALEKPEAWEYRLFLQTWVDECDSRGFQLREYHTRLTLDAAEFIVASDAIQWLQTRTHELENFVNSANTLVNTSAKEAFGPAGHSGDAEYIVWVSHMLGTLLGRSISWAQRIRCARVESPFDRLMPELALFADDLITQLQSFPREALQRLEDAVRGKSGEVKMTMNITLSNQEAFYRAFDQVRRSYGVKRAEQS